MALTVKQSFQLGKLIMTYGNSAYTEGTIQGDPTASPEKLARQQQTTREFVLRIKDVLEALTDPDKEDKVES